MAADRGKVLGVIVALLAGLAALAWAAGGLWVAKHEADTLHLIDIVLRRAGGAVPHVDYATPVGALAFEPFAALLRAGMPLGNALIWGQILLAALIAPAAWWVAVSRLSTPLAIGFVAAVLLLTGGMVFGGLDPKLSLSMHYNRWAWALSFLPLLIAVLPGRRAAPLADGAVAGGAMAVLALMKVTVFVAFAPAVVAGLALRREGRTLAVAVVAGLLVCLAFTMGYGAAIWPAYMGDLLDVARSQVRAAPAGAGPMQVLIWPEALGATLVGALSVIMLRLKARGSPIGAVLALVLAGAVYATYQNYGNDPIWLILWGIVLLSLPEEARGWRKAPLAGVVALALIFPAAVNIAASPLRQVTQPRAVYEPLFAAEDRVFGVSARFAPAQGQGPLDGTGCTLAGGLVGWLRDQGAALEAAGLGGRPLFVADIFSFQWMFGDFPPLKGGAPWLYGGLPGVEAAELLVVPNCASDPGLRDAVMDEIEARGTGLTPVLESDLMTVFEIDG